MHATAISFATTQGFTCESRPTWVAHKAAGQSLITTVGLDVRMTITAVLGSSVECASIFLHDPIGRDFLVSLGVNLSTYTAKVFGSLFCSRGEIKNLIFAPEDMHREGSIAVFGKPRWDAAQVFQGYTCLVHDLRHVVRQNAAA